MTVLKQTASQCRDIGFWSSSSLPGLSQYLCCSDLKAFLSFPPECTEPIRRGWQEAFCNDLHEHPRAMIQVTKMAAELLLSPWINKVLLQNQQKSFTDIPAPMQYMWMSSVDL